MIDQKTIKDTIQELTSFAYSGFLQPSKKDLLKYAKLIEHINEENITLNQRLNTVIWPNSGKDI